MPTGTQIGRSGIHNLRWRLVVVECFRRPHPGDTRRPQRRGQRQHRSYDQRSDQKRQPPTSSHAERMPRSADKALQGRSRGDHNDNARTPISILWVISTSADRHERETTPACGGPPLHSQSSPWPHGRTPRLDEPREHGQPRRGIVETSPHHAAPRRVIAELRRLAEPSPEVRCPEGPPRAKCPISGRATLRMKPADQRQGIRSHRWPSQNPPAEVSNSPC